MAGSAFGISDPDIPYRYVIKLDSNSNKYHYLKRLQKHSSLKELDIPTAEKKLVRHDTKIKHNLTDFFQHTVF